MALPAALALLLPFLVSTVAGLFAHNWLPQWAEALIALVVLMVVAVAWSLLDQKLTGNLVADIALIAAYCAALMAGPLQPLYQWLKLNTPSPLAALRAPAPRMATQGTTSSAATTVPPRASALPVGQSYVARPQTFPVSLTSVSTSPPPPPPIPLTPQTDGTQGR